LRNLKGVGPWKGFLERKGEKKKVKGLAASRRESIEDLNTGIVK